MSGSRGCVTEKCKTSAVHSRVSKMGAVAGTRVAGGGGMGVAPPLEDGAIEIRKSRDRATPGWWASRLIRRLTPDGREHPPHLGRILRARFQLQRALEGRSCLGI